jgi:hypothetical protein
MRAGVLLTALALALTGIGCLVAAIVWEPAAPPWQRTLYTFLGQVWPLFVVTSALLTGYEIYLRQRLIAELTEIAGPAIVQALQPQQVLATLLDSIYGEHEANHEVVASVLGGEGRLPRGGDLTISAHTTVEFVLSAVDHETYHLTSAISHSFKKNVTADRFIIFATCNALLRDSIVSGCQLPLFELWFIPDEALFQQSVEDMLPSVSMSISYLDEHDMRHETNSSKTQPRNVRVDRWPEHLLFFREATSTLPRQNARDYLGTLRIFECDLRDIAQDGHTVSSIERLTLRFTLRLRIDDGYCYWQAPYPCYVDKILINAQGLDPDGSGSGWRFRVVPFTFRSNTGSARWLPAVSIGELDVRSWLLPGHGVALLWRANNRPELP